MIMNSFEKQFERPVGMLVYMKECIMAFNDWMVQVLQGLFLHTELTGLVTTAVTDTIWMSAGKKTNKRKASSVDSSSEEKVAKRTKTAFEQARRIMKSELETMGFKEVEDYGNMEWNTFKTEHAEVSTTNNKVQVTVLWLLHLWQRLPQLGLYMWLVVTC